MLVLLVALTPLCFNSRTPGGVRLYRSILSTLIRRFQFTHPGRGATGQSTPCRQNEQSFNSRTPGGVRLSHCSQSCL